MHHHLPVTPKVLALASNHDPNIRHGGADGWLGPDEIVQPFVWPDATKEQDRVAVFAMRWLAAPTEQDVRNHVHPLTGYAQPVADGRSELRGLHDHFISSP